MKKFLFMFVLILTFSASSFTTQASVRKFTDLDSSHWAYPYVQIMADKEYVIGYEDGSFRPNAPFNRAAFAKLLTLSFDLSPANEDLNLFEDLPSSHWAYPYVMGGISYLTYYEEGMNLYYYPDAPAVREEVAVAMVLAAGLDPTNADMNYLADFNDSYEISEELKPYVALAVEYGIMNGTGENFDPQGTLTRAQGCTLFARYMTELSTTLDIHGWYLVDKEYIISPFDISVRGEREDIKDDILRIIHFRAKGSEGDYQITASWRHPDSNDPEKETTYYVMFESPPNYIAPTDYVELYLSHSYFDDTPFMYDNAYITASYEKDLFSGTNGDLLFVNDEGISNIKNDFAFLTSESPLGESNPGEHIYIKINMGQDYGYIYTYEYR